MPKSVVCGGATYFSRIARASRRRRFSIARADLLDAGRVGALLRLDQALVVLARKLAVDRQPERRAVVAPARQLDRELDARAGAGHRLDVGRVLLEREHLLEQRGELHLAEDAARLDVARARGSASRRPRRASASRRGRCAPARAARPPGGSSRRGAARASHAASRRPSARICSSFFSLSAGSRRARSRPSRATSPMR